MSDRKFERLRAAVFEDRALQDELYAVEDRSEFVAAVVDAATNFGISISASDVTDAMNAGHRAWLERWI